MAGYNDPDDAEIARLTAERDAQALRPMKDPLRSRGVVSEELKLAMARDRNDPMWRGFVNGLKAQRDAALARAEKAELQAAVTKAMIQARGTNRDYQQARAEKAEERNSHLRDMVAELLRVQAENVAALARVAELEALVGELADDVEAHCQAEYELGERARYPVQEARYQRDTEVVRRARALLAPAETTDGEGR